MMYSNDMDANPYQQKIQGQQQFSNLGAMAPTASVGDTVADMGAERVAELSSAQKSQDLFRTSEAIMIKAMADKNGQDSTVQKMADPNFMATVNRSLGEQSRLRMA
jgi:hypothetical protein